MALDVNQDVIDDMNDKSGELLLDYYPEILGSCGNGAFVLSEIKYPISVPKRLISSYYPFSKYFVINAQGDSMNPTIMNKDLLIVEQVKNEPIRDNEIYIFRYGETLYVKRLVNNITCILVKSDNKEYDTNKIGGNELSNLEIIGRVVGLMRSF